MKTANLIVSGLVQCVGFRHNVKDYAITCGLKGTVKNLEDETVQIICEGEDDHVEKFIQMIHNTKKPVRIEDIKITYLKPTVQYTNFKIILGDVTKEMLEGITTGAVYLSRLDNKQDQMLDKQDQMLDKQDQMLDKQDQMLDKQDQMLGKQETTIGEIRSLSFNIREMINDRFQKLEDEIKIIKTKLYV